jgi:hypothetical protein
MVPGARDLRLSGAGPCLRYRSARRSLEYLRLSDDSKGSLMSVTSVLEMREV